MSWKNERRFKKVFRSLGDDILEERLSAQVAIYLFLEIMQTVSCFHNSFDNQCSDVTFDLTHKQNKIRSSFSEGGETNYIM